MRVIHSPENKHALEALQAVNFAADNQPAIQLPQSRNMEEAFDRKKDEFDVDFEYASLAEVLFLLVESYW